MASIKDYSPQEFFNIFPNLQSNYRQTSNPEIYYNCVAWALKIENKWIDAYSYYWPADLERTHTTQNYADFYRREGFEICENGEIEENMEKIALFGDESGLFKHVAIQLKNGHWSSKLGKLEDIEHFTLEALEGGSYGKIDIFMKRNIRE